MLLQIKFTENKDVLVRGQCTNLYLYAFSMHKQLLLLVKYMLKHVNLSFILPIVKLVTPM